MTGRHRMGVDPIPDAVAAGPEEPQETTESDGSPVENPSE
jgi:hypothetical protein